MRGELRLKISMACWIAVMVTHVAVGQDWPQWRGTNRDARAAGFEAPATWPEQLTEKWKITIGAGVASPSLVGDKLYVFARQDGNEILHCLHASTGEEIWKDQYEAEAIRGPASGFDGPRCSPTVAEGKVVTLGAQGMLSCYDAESGELVWRKDENVGNVPRFATSSSPIVAKGLVVTEFGADQSGGLAAYDLNSGEEKWKWAGSGATYGSPVQMTIDGAEAIVSPMSDKLVVISVADGKVLLEMPYSQGRYNSATPIIHDDTLILAGPDRGMTALELKKDGDEVVPEEEWKNIDNSLAFNTPVMKDGKLYGISGLNSLFCIDAENGETEWNAPLGGEDQAQAGQDAGGRRSGGAEGERRGPRGEGERPRGGAESDRPGRDGGPGGPGANADGQRRGRGGRRGGRGGGGYGSVVDADSALLALIPSGQLTVFAPGDEYNQLATYKVAEAGAYAYPVPSKYGLFIKDQDSIALWSTQ